MEGSGHEVIVTSPKYVWLGTSLEQEEPPVLAVLVGKSIEYVSRHGLSADESLALLRRENEEMDIIALFFECEAGSWKEVPTEKVGDSPYLVANALAFNCFYAIRGCNSCEEQTSLLRELGIAIDEQFVGC